MTKMLTVQPHAKMKRYRAEGWTHLHQGQHFGTQQEAIFKV